RQGAPFRLSPATIPDFRSSTRNGTRAAAVPTTTPNDAPIRNFDDLLGIFRQAEKAESRFRVVAEMATFGVDATTGAPIRYDGPRGVLHILEQLAQRYGWGIEREQEGGPIIALYRDGASVTLEPGSQLELSGAPLRTIHEICAELR